MEMDPPDPGVAQGPVLFLTPSHLRERHRKHPMRVATVRERVEHRGLILVS